MLRAVKSGWILSFVVLAGGLYSETGAQGGLPPSRFTHLEPERLQFGSLAIYSENDVYLGGTDQYYTNGFKLTALTTNLRDFTDPRLPAPLRWAARRVDRLVPRHEVPKVGFSLGQHIYTPRDVDTEAFVPGDRPYAAWLYLGASYQSYRPAPEQGPGPAARLSVVEINLGIIGPGALGRQVQNGFHKITGTEPARGWHHQLRNEPGINLVYERRWRYSADLPRTGWEAQFIPHAGFSLGNVFTFANVGGEVRAGFRLPDNFGTNLIRPTGTSGPTRRYPFSVFLFSIADGRAVLRDITLDGNTFRSGPSVPKKPVVGDFLVGVGLGIGRWQATYSQAVRTREFEGQASNQDFGSISLTLHY